MLPCTACAEYFARAVSLHVNLGASDPAPSTRRGATLAILTLAAVAISLVACMGYAPGAKSYWDERVKEMCARDGGVTAHERVYLSQEEFKQLGGIERALPLPNENRAPVGYPYVRRVIDIKLNESNPEVIRSETQVIRQLDGKVLGRSVRYWRRGGDIPTGVAHESSVICPEGLELTPLIFLSSEAPR
jgi:hypothetical protein